MIYVPSKRLVTAPQAMKIEGFQDARNRFGKTVDGIFFGPVAFGDADLADFEGNAYHVWRIGWQKERVMSYDEARKQVDRDVRAYRAYERAGLRAGELLEELKQFPVTAEAPLDELAKKHAGLTVKTTKPFFLGSAENAPRRAGPAAGEEAQESVRQGVFARLIRSEDPQVGDAAVAGDRIARVQYLIRITKRTEPDLLGFRLMKDRHRLLALQRKRDDFLEAWREEVKKRANVQPAKKELSEGRKEP